MFRAAILLVNYNEPNVQAAVDEVAGMLKDHDELTADGEKLVLEAQRRIQSLKTTQAVSSALLHRNALSWAES
jgi:hypothetical protein